MTEYEVNPHDALRSASKVFMLVEPPLGGLWTFPATCLLCPSAVDARGKVHRHLLVSSHLSPDTFPRSLKSICMSLSACIFPNSFSK